MSSANSSAATRRANQAGKDLARFSRSPSSRSAMNARFSTGALAAYPPGEPDRQAVDEPVHSARLTLFARVPRELRGRPPCMPGPSLPATVAARQRREVRVAREGDVERVRAAGRRRGAAAAPLGRAFDPRSRRAGASAAHGPTGPAARRWAVGDQPQRFLGGAGQVLRGCGFQRAVRPGGSGRASAPTTARGTPPPPRTRRARGPVRRTAPARGRRSSSGSGHRVSAMPGPAIGVGVRDRWRPPSA